jgi:hypothetical protein
VDVFGDVAVPLFGDVGAVGGVTVPGDVGALEVAGGVGMVLPEPDGEAPGDVPGVDVPGEAGLVVPGVALPEGCAVGVCTVPSEFTQGVVLPGAVVPGNVLGGFAGDPGCACELDGLEVDGLGVVPGVVPEPLLVGVQGGKLLGGFIPGVAGLVVAPC